MRCWPSPLIWTGPLSLVAADSYVSIAQCVDQMLLVGCPCSLLQGWIDVVEMSDLPLHRVDWTVSSAQRGLMLEHQEWSGDIAWVFADASSCRLAVIRAGVPELDCCLQNVNDDNLALELRRWIASWQVYSGYSLPLVWCLCLPQQLLTALESLIDPDRGETSFASEGLWPPKAVTPDDEVQGFQLLELLALQGMREDIYR